MLQQLNIPALASATKKQVVEGCCIGFMYEHDMFWVMKHLPIWQQAKLPIVAVNGVGIRTAASNWLELQDVPVLHRTFTHDWAQQGNALLQFAATFGYTRLLRLDPDETMFAKDILEVFRLLQTDCAIRLPRINFEDNNKHYCNTIYPDWQTRGMCLTQKTTYTSRVHETVITDLPIIDVPHLPIYHYEGLINKKQRLLKNINYKNVAYNLPLQAALTSEQKALQFGSRPNIPYTKEQPQ